MCLYYLFKTQKYRRLTKKKKQIYKVFVPSVAPIVTTNSTHLLNVCPMNTTRPVVQQQNYIIKENKVIIYTTIDLQWCYCYAY